MATEFVGKVISNRMQKSVLVAVDRLVRHKKYDRLVKRTTKLMAHDERDDCNVGDTVRVHISRPLSKRKCWVVTQILHRARVFDAESAAQAAAADAAAHHAGGGLGAPSFAASALSSSGSAGAR
ncbi:hypothetical protein ABPG77_003581 [Micractinium sp. CCAP 211/92]